LAGFLASARIVIASAAGEMVGIELAGRARALLDVLVGDGHRRVAVEGLRRSAPRRARRRASTGRCGVDVQPLRLLGRQVGGGAEHGGGAGDGLVVDRAGDPEVGDLHGAVVGEQDVAGLDVAVDQAPVVGVGQGRADVGRRPPARGPRSARRPRSPAAASALDQLHDDVGLALVGAGVVDGDEVGVVEPGDVAGLVLEPAREALVLAEALEQQLDRDLATERRSCAA
jgi:hypothetical protein